MLIEGIASTLEVDHDGDVVDPKGAQFRLPLPLLIDHDENQQVGEVVAAEQIDGGIWVRCRVDDRDAQSRVQSGELGGFSVKFKTLAKSKSTGIGGVTRITRWEWQELTLCQRGTNRNSSAEVLEVNGGRLGAVYL